MLADSHAVQLRVLRAFDHRWLPHRRCFRRKDDPGSMGEDKAKVKSCIRNALRVQAIRPIRLMNQRLCAALAPTALLHLDNHRGIVFSRRLRLDRRLDQTLPRNLTWSWRPPFDSLGGVGFRLWLRCSISAHERSGTNAEHRAK